MSNFVFGLLTGVIVTASLVAFFNDVGVDIGNYGFGEAAKAARERGRAIDKATAQVIREHGLDKEAAFARAVKEYADNLKAAL